MKINVDMWLYTGRFMFYEEKFSALFFLFRNLFGAMVFIVNFSFLLELRVKEKFSKYGLNFMFKRFLMNCFR